MQNADFEKKRLDTGMGQITYFVAGRTDNEKPAVVLLHGLSANHTTWLKAVGGLVEAGHRVIMPDLRGHGESDQQMEQRFYRFDVFTSDLKQILGRERVRRAVLVGYSFGGSVAMRFAVDDPGSVAGLLLISANHHDPLEYWHVRFLRPAVRAAAFLLGKIFRLQRRRVFSYYDPNIAKGYWSSTFQGFQTMPIAVNLWMLAMMAELDLRGRLSAIKVPVAIVFSSRDPFLSEAEVADMQAQLPQAQVFRLDNGSHFIASQDQAETAKLINAFLQAL